VVVGERASCLLAEVSGQPHAGWIDLRALTGDPDRSGILGCGRYGLTDPREPVEDRLGLFSE